MKFNLLVSALVAVLMPFAAAQDNDRLPQASLESRNQYSARCRYSSKWQIAATSNSTELLQALLVLRWRLGPVRQ
jgi:hypothetical protein